MAEFIRARSAEQKGQRIAQIKAAALAQLATRPYHEVTLTTVADELGWSRAGLYKYVTTKEEIFLLAAADARDAYLDALLAALPEGCGLAPDVVAEVWAGIANAHQEWFRLGELLFAVIETNVGVGRLVEFKRGYYERADVLCERLAGLLKIDAARAEGLLNAVHHHAVGLVGTCASNPLVTQALAQIGRARTEVDFLAEMRDFIGMCLDHWTRGAER